MNRQKFILLIVFMVVLMGVIAAVNHYYFQPEVLLTMPSIEKIKVFGKTKNSFKSDPYAGTMEKIRSNSNRGEQDTASLLLTTANRNPFLWIEESTDPAASPDVSRGTLPGETLPGETPKTLAIPGPKPGVSTWLDTVKGIMTQEFTLTMVIVGETRKLALVNNHFVSEGSKIGGWDVVKIEPQRVVLASKNNKKELTLAPSGGPLQYHKASEKKKAREKESPVTAFLDVKTQLKQVLKLYSDPNLILNDKKIK